MFNVSTYAYYSQNNVCNSLQVQFSICSTNYDWHALILTGSAFGLSLILNIEQYEYMLGSANDVGVKVRQQPLNAYNFHRSTPYIYCKPYKVLNNSWRYHAIVWTNVY